MLNFKKSVKIKIMAIVVAIFASSLLFAQPIIAKEAVKESSRSASPFSPPKIIRKIIDKLRGADKETREKIKRYIKRIKKSFPVKRAPSINTIIPPEHKD